MLKDPLPPVDLTGRWTLGEALQAFALTYLARYSTVGASSRAIASYFKAWGMQDLHQYARVTNGRMGFIWTAIEYSWGMHVVVAIEGMTSLRQLHSLGHGSGGMIPPTVGSGKIYTYTKIYTDQIFALLMADTNFVAALSRPSTQLTLAGFSMGATIADALSVQFAAYSRGLTIRCRKFGSPAFANSVYNETRPGRIMHSSVYAEGDPVCRIFRSGVAGTSDGFFNLPVGFANCQIEPEAECWGSDGFPVNFDFSISYLNNARAYTAMLLPLNTLNGWYYHQAHNYRAICNTLASKYERLFPLRMNYLEHNDEDQWQTHSPNWANWDASWIALGSSPPADYDSLTTDQRNLLRSTVPAAQMPPERVPDFDGGGGGDDDVIPPVLSNTRRRNRHLVGG